MNYETNSIGARAAIMNGFLDCMEFSVHVCNKDIILHLQYSVHQHQTKATLRKIEIRTKTGKIY